MKILYAVQATGNGHLSRCMEFYPVLSKYAEVDVLLSGIQGDLKLPFPIKFKKHGMGFVFGKKGGIDYIRTALSLRPFRFIWDVFRFDLTPYDLVVNDFEPISAWACKFAKKECVSLSHQAAFISNKTPRPKRKGWFAEFLFKHFSPSTKAIGLHYQSFDNNIYTPVVRSEIRNIKTNYASDEILVYLPAYSEDLLVEKFSKFDNFKWQIFSKHIKEEKPINGINIYPVGTPKWLEVMSSAGAAIIGGGFEGPSEMLYLNKKLMVIPMLDQYEQLCNATALENMGVRVVYGITEDFEEQITDWIENVEPIEVDFPQQSDFLVKMALNIAD